jgi:peptidoglycan/xylan/chitin deacetylase (PgdA/CDA1 family)
MAEVEIARPRGVTVRARPKGFMAFCALLLALIAVFVLNPFAAGADHRTGGSPAGDTRNHAGRSAPAGPRPDAGSVEGATAVASTRPAGGTTALDRLIAAARPIRCGAGTRPLVALTFDDGPGVLTQQTLDLLRARGMTATFFLAGKLVGEPRFEGLASKAARLGAIGDHTWDHVSVVGLSASELDAEIGRTRRAIAAETGERVVLFRPPLGQQDERVRGYVRSLGMLTVLWSLESGDSQGASAERIYRAVRGSLSPGDIVLLHENRGTTQRALPLILDLIEARGYRTVTVPELLELDPPTNEQLRLGTCPA